jgi:hypothetical protein
MGELGLPGTIHDYHEDHLVPLCVGGHPSDERNLWPEPVDGKWNAAVKDQLESSVCRQVYRGDMQVRAAELRQASVRGRDRRGAQEEVGISATT